MFKHIALLGAQGTIGSALLKQLRQEYPGARIHAFSRSTPTNQPLPEVAYHCIDYDDEDSLQTSANIASDDGALDLVVVAVGILHDGEIKPEKNIKELSSAKFNTLFQVNTIIPALVAKHFLPKLTSDRRAVFAALSARVGSISDNRLGGWYAYRASKAALNMIIKNLSIETQRLHRQAIIVGLHPGTVDTPLSAPYHQRIPKDQIFTAEQSAEKLLGVIESLKPEDSGACFAWDGKRVEP